MKLVMPLDTGMNMFKKKSSYSILTRYCFLSDRDKYIDVIWDNIRDDDKHNFVKQESIKINSRVETRQ